jgi:hypothetical protein
MNRQQSARWGKPSVVLGESSAGQQGEVNRQQGGMNHWSMDGVPTVANKLASASAMGIICASVGVTAAL